MDCGLEKRVEHREEGLKSDAEFAPLKAIALNHVMDTETTE